MGAGESEFVKLRAFEPVAVRFGVVVREFRAVSFQRDSVARDGVPDGAERRVAGWLEVRVRLCSKALRFAVSRLNFNIWKLPEMGIHQAFRSLADMKSAVAFDDEGDEVASG